jgi:hypothetical protein
MHIDDDGSPVNCQRIVRGSCILRRIVHSFAFSIFSLAGVTAVTREADKGRNRQYQSSPTARVSQPRKIPLVDVLIQVQVHHKCTEGRL